MSQVRWRPRREGSGSSARLTRAAAAGDPRAFEEIFRAYHQEIYRYCLAILHDVGDAEDAMQATMAAALRALPGEEREIALKPWLYRVAHNEAISVLRRRRDSVAPEDLPESGEASAAEDAERRERLRALVTDLNALPERQRGALVMRELSGLEYEEIGAFLGCSEPAARQAVYEARLALRERSKGRDMSCEEARRAISDGDRRRLRGRKLKAHLASCEGCRDFQAAIDVRRDDFQALCPALPAAAASGMLAGLIGAASANAAGTGAAAGGGAVAAGAGGGAAAGLAGAGGAAAGLAGTGAAKVAAVAAAAVIAAGAGEATGVIDVPGPIDVGQEVEEPSGAPVDGAGATGKPGAARALEARTRGEEASAAKGDNRAARAVEARAKHGHKGKRRHQKRHGRKGKGPSQPGSNGVGTQGGAPPGVGNGAAGGAAPASPPSAPGQSGGGAPGAGAPSAGKSPASPPASGGKGNSQSKGGPPPHAAPRTGGPPS